MGDWQQSESIETRTRVTAIAHDQDLLAQAEALSTIEKQHPEITRYVVFVLGLFVCLDLVALMMKLSHLLIGGAMYEEVAAALRERDQLEAHRLRERTAVLRKRISGEAGADADVDEVESKGSAPAGSPPRAPRSSSPRRRRAQPPGA